MKFIANCVVFLLLITVFSVSASMAAVVRIVPEKIELNSIGVGNSFTVSVTIENVENLAGFEFDLAYNPAAVTIEDSADVLLGDFLENTGRTVSLLGPVINNAIGRLETGAFSFGNEAGASGGGSLIQIVFTVKSLRIGSLDLQEVLLTDTVAATLPIDQIVQGQLAVQTPGPTPDPDPTPYDDYDNDGVSDPVDNCPYTYNPGQSDSDGDGSGDTCEACPEDSSKILPGICGCGISDVDGDEDGVPDCNDGCPGDPLKTAAGQCGCGVLDTDRDADGRADCNDLCPDDPGKRLPETCGCGVADIDADQNGVLDCLDQPSQPGNDGDGDGIPDDEDQCPFDPNKSSPGICGCGVVDLDSDGDGTPDCLDICPNDSEKDQGGVCGCNIPDLDSDGDGTPDCIDGCPEDFDKRNPGTCGCGSPDIDSDGDGLPDCLDGCPYDALKIAPGLNGCGMDEPSSPPQLPIQQTQGGAGDTNGCFIQTLW